MKIGQQAPSFVAQTTQGKLRFPEDYKGKWVILFSHPADFTPVCTTEFMKFASMRQEFKDLNCELVGLSIDGVFAHIAWLRTIKEKVEYNGLKNIDIDFPVIADLKMEVAEKYEMIHPDVDDTKTVRTVFFIDPEGIIRAYLVYPMATGRNFSEIKRILVAMQTADQHGVATPADWEPGDDVIVPPPTNCKMAQERMDNSGNDYEAMDWFLSFKKLPKDAVLKEKSPCGCS